MADTSLGGGSRDFPSTRWTKIIQAQETGERQKLLEELAVLYWKPLYFYARRKGQDVEGAKDIVQALFARLVEKDEFVERLSPDKGSLRAYLRRTLDHLLVNQHEARSAKKRGGGAKLVSLDALGVDNAEKDLAGSPQDAEAAYDQEWALSVLERALARLERELPASQADRFKAARAFFQPKEPPSYADAAKACGMTVAGFKAYLHRTRERYRKIVAEEVADTTAAEGVAREVDDLVRVLRG